ncbi:MAG: hypothetical protein ABIH58_02145 [Patescibacteria group bacterium]
MEAIKASELKIGNWVRNIDGVEYPIENGWQLDEGDTVYPVPLTEEWLLKFGFEYDTITYSRGELMLSSHSDIDLSSYNVWWGTLTYGNLNFQIKYVHQLQNLYFALTGDELTIKPIKK